MDTMIKVIAFASSDGKTVDEHFGRCKRFWIYQLDDTAYVFVRTQEIDLNGDTCERLPLLIEKLSECDMVIAEKIGRGAKALLAGKEIYPMEFKGEIQFAVGKLASYLLKEKK